VAEQKHDESFKVVDRRLFTPEGELRKEILDEERAQTEAEAKKERKTAAASQAHPAPADKPGDKQARTAAPGGAAVSGEAPKPSHAFELLIDLVARNAGVLLGGFADPQTGQAILDLEGARDLIDMLDALREKTRGNLTPAEEQLLIEVLGSLKLNYLEISKAAAQAMREKAGKS